MICLRVGLPEVKGQGVSWRVRQRALLYLRVSLELLCCLTVKAEQPDTVSRSR